MKNHQSSLQDPTYPHKIVRRSKTTFKRGGQWHERISHLGDLLKKFQDGESFKILREILHRP